MKKNDILQLLGVTASAFEHFRMRRVNPFPEPITTSPLVWRETSVRAWRNDGLGLTVADLCSIFDVSPVAIRAWRDQDDFPKPKMVGRSLLWEVHDIDQWWNDNSEFISEDQVVAIAGFPLPRILRLSGRATRPFPMHKGRPRQWNRAAVTEWLNTERLIETAMAAEDVADMIGVSRPTLNRLVASDGFPQAITNQPLRWDRSAIEQWWADHGWERANPDDDLVDVAGVAALLGIRPASVKHRTDLPKRVRCDNDPSAYWRRADIVAYVDQEKTRNIVKDDEITYTEIVERFRRKITTEADFPQPVRSLRKIRIWNRSLVEGYVASRRAPEDTSLLSCSDIAQRWEMTVAWVRMLTRRDDFPQPKWIGRNGRRRWDEGDIAEYERRKRDTKPTTLRVSLSDFAKIVTEATDYPFRSEGDHVILTLPTQEDADRISKKIFA